MNERRDISGVQVQSTDGHYASIELGLPRLDGDMVVSFHYRGDVHSIVTSQDATEAQVSAAVLDRLDALDPDLDWAGIGALLSGEEV
jgi:hypothetical protein